MSQVVLEPDVESLGAGSARWMLVLYNNDFNTFDEVISILIEATGCDIEEAEIEAWEAHAYGKAPVHFASKEECLSAEKILQSIGLRTMVQPEWEA